MEELNGLILEAAATYGQSSHVKVNLKELMRKLNQRPIAVYPAYIDMTGSLEGGMLLSQLMYWYAAMGKKFYKTDEEIIKECKLKDREFRRAKTSVKKLPFIFVTKEGVPCKTFYDIDMEGLALYLSQTESSQVIDISSSYDGVRTSSNDGVRTGSYDGVRTITENTSEITTEINNKTYCREIEKSDFSDDRSVSPLPQITISKKQKLEEETQEILSHLNDTRVSPTGRKGKMREPGLIPSALKRGYTVAQLKLVIDWWAGVKVKKDPSMYQYFNINTPFQKSKLAGYLDAAEEWEEMGRPSPDLGDESSRKAKFEEEFSKFLEETND